MIKGHTKVIEVYRANILNDVRLIFSLDLFHLVCFDETRQKVNYKFIARGQEKVTKGQNLIFTF